MSKIMSKNFVTPEDILADNENNVNLSGVSARKGSIAAFLANIKLIEDPNLTQEDKKKKLLRWCVL